MLDGVAHVFVKQVKVTLHFIGLVTHFDEELGFLSAADRKLIMGEAILKFLDWK